MTRRRSAGRIIGMATVGVLPAVLISAVISGGSASAEPNLPAVWCSLNVGDAKDAVLAGMGAPNGNQADSWVTGLGDTGMTFAEWDADTTIFLATFDTNDRVINLQAYDGQIGPKGATNIGCPAFRAAN
ncbi:hypothetical protein [Nocardia sp. NBC_01327]|uniref:hypothetical protein n=1 Tax=Nocardia sp. NBC_01327 TaxID=2903593 RepID=UPI002E145317|nr:hypothetical protein OG326_40890 [Nocardia sp. NBC_01327]